SKSKFDCCKPAIKQSQPGLAGWIMPLVPFHFTLVQNIKRRPFEQAVGIDPLRSINVSGVKPPTASCELAHFVRCVYVLSRGSDVTESHHEHDERYKNDEKYMVGLFTRAARSFDRSSANHNRCCKNHL